ncbi:MAG: 16S rRNA (guanine(527)-N(7))-methyltransferase RsmG [Nitrospirae bacterium]|nr:16S rRNA (guanine(527)-N(7))-methyltransferase RsmG [Nitrospirota bacterium]
MSKEAADVLLRNGLKILDIPFTEDQIKQFLIYLAELKKWNSAYNLTALKTDADIVIKHFLDSLLFLKVLPPQVKSIADIGSGAGFPGLPLKIMRPDIAVVLIEPVQKKALFLEHMQRMLNMTDTKIMNIRLEDIRDLLVDAAVTRALFSVGDFIGKAERILEEKGVLILSKGPKLEEELRGLETSAIRREDIVLPFEKSIRHLIVVEKRSQK